MTLPAVSVPKPIKYQELSEEQRDLIKRTIAKGASDDELMLFIAVCNSTGLNPFNRQIYAIKRRSQEAGQWVETMTYQVGIEGFRLMAQRSKAKGGPVYQGQTEPQWCANDGNWIDLWTSADPPFAAKVGVYVEGFREPIYAIAEYKRLVQTKQGGGPNIFWEKGPAFQLAKCAEAAALRKAIGNDLSGVYLEEEIYATPEEKDITPPMTIEDHKKALAPPPVQPGPQTKDPDPPDPPTPDPPKGEEIVSPERRQEVITHLQNMQVQEKPPENMTETEAGLLLECKRSDKAGRRLDVMAMGRDTQGKMV